MYRPKSVRHIRFEPTHLLFDARHIFAPLNAAKQRGAIKQSTRLEKVEDELGQTSLYLATRANIIKTAVETMNRHMEDLIEIVKASTDPPEFAITAPDSIVYGLLLNMDSFIFEAQAFEEALRKFFMNVAKRLLNLSAKAADDLYEKIASQAGMVNNEPWKRFLYRIRMTFIHTAAPWFAVDVSQADKNVFDFLMMSENIKDFANAKPESFLPAIRDMNQLWACLQTIAHAVEEFLIDRISKLK
jgi:hypothetical protein